jgi:transcriptional regulator with XRE-family HTH domain
MANRQLSPLAQILRRLRREQGLSLRQVQEQTGNAVSNVYLSQLETGKRRDPNPRVLVALASVYGVPSRLLFEKAGYVAGPGASAVEVAFQQVLADPTFQFGTRFHGDLDEESKRVIIELYERATRKKLLTDKRDEPGSPD